ncbi:MAG: 4-hydroxy-3-methylbut-2-enyl diphosphate reductase [Sedimentisphaerales bacterium]|nr:4-hydroxy-3-methylbut-2-enyl diphosphate reductase [Sedimentisphaerales bacterium]
MEVIVAEKCGFCAGVTNAIKLAEKVLQEKKQICSLGPIIHNNDVVSKLADMGLETVENIDQIKSGTVLIRSHGAAPAQIEQLKERGLEIVNATCVLVKRVQKIASELESQGYKVVLLGNKDHPEVKAVVGSAKDVTVVADKEDLHKLPKDSMLGVICQTTQSLEYFCDMLRAICLCGFREIRAINTLCEEAIKRQQSAVDLCKKVDIMFVLGGLNSANTRKLAELCRQYNSETYHLQNWSGFDKSKLLGKTKAGVTAGASTPQWIIAEFVRKLKEYDNKTE